jgi:hypothetical protein
MPLCVTITPPAAPASLSRPYNSMVRSRVSTFAAMLGDSMPRYQVTCNSPPTPSHHASPLVSALPPRCVRKRSSATVHRHVLPPSQRASARTTSMLHVAVAPAPSCRVTARRTGRCGRGVYRAARGEQVMVAMRKTRNKSKSHHKPTVPRVQPLLKCAPSRSVGADG